MKKSILTLMAALLAITECLAWGQVGHDATCNIAERHLTKKALKRITTVLDGKSIVYWSNWLDNASHQPEYAYAKTWHYKNIDEGQRYEDVPPFETGDVVTAIAEQWAKLKAGGLSHEEEALALKMLVHLVGDLHQPMHMGHQTDLGGNRVNVEFFKEKTNLHHVWDEDLVEAGHHWTYDEWTVQIDRATRQQEAEIVRGSLDDWGRETYDIATLVYKETPAGTKLSYDEVARWTPVIEEQFLKGGLRLAHILNEIYK